MTQRLYCVTGLADRPKLDMLAHCCWLRRACQVLESFGESPVEGLHAQLSGRMTSRTAATAAVQCLCAAFLDTLIPIAAAALAACPAAACPAAAVPQG